jgi:hypothetical protein
MRISIIWMRLGCSGEWRVNSGLSSTSTRGVKADKSRISIVVCTNASGSKKMPLWFIGKAKSPKNHLGMLT